MIPDDQYKLYAAGKFNDTPILVGYNSDEGQSFSPPSTPEDYIATVKERYGPFADRLIKAYPPGEGTVSKTARDLARDATFGWHTWIWARLQSQQGKGKAYLYCFDQHPDYPADSPRAGYGSPHGQEVAYVFEHLNPSQAMPRDQAISDAMATYWTNFAKYGDPNGAGRSAVAGLQRRESRGDVLSADAAHRTGAERRRAEGPGRVLRLAADAGGRSVR